MLRYSLNRGAVVVHLVCYSAPWYLCTSAAAVRITRMNIHMRCNTPKPLYGSQRSAHIPKRLGRPATYTAHRRRVGNTRVHIIRIHTVRTRINLRDNLPGKRLEILSGHIYTRPAMCLLEQLCTHARTAHACGYDAAAGEISATYIIRPFSRDTEDTANTASTWYIICAPDVYNIVHVYTRHVSEAPAAAATE